jgi:aldehyde dehydrogenase (NAD+)
MIRRCFQPEFAAVIEGGRETSEALLAQKFDKIFFTGSTAIGRKVMAAAARHLTPVTLELGGKSPCIVAADAPVETTARRIVWGKFMNAGQTCVAPDFVVAHRNVAAGLVDAMKSTLREFYGDDPQLSADYGRIINQHHFKRLMALLDGGHPDAAHPDTAPDAAHPDAAHPDAADLYIAPTILQDVSWDSPLMQDEIFGPILPVMVYDDIDELLCKLRDMPPPLALYLFTNHRALREKVLAGTRSGGVCVNDTISHIIGRDLPFGGVGDSGMGSYHGRAGFECFSHQRAVMRRRSGIDPDFRYPPPKAPLAMLKKIMRWFG